MVNYYEFLDEYNFYAPKEQDPCLEVSHDTMKVDTKENGDQVVAPAPALAPPGRMYEAFPKKWYLTGKIPNVLASRTEDGPYELINLTNVSIVHTGAEPTTYWIYIGVMVSTDVLQKLRGYKPSADAQSMEVEVSVKIDNSMVTKFKSVHPLLNQHDLLPDVPIVLRAHQEIRLDREQKLQLAFKPKNQIMQAGGLRILWIEMIDLKSARDPDTSVFMTAAAHEPQSPVIEVKSNSSAFSKGDDVIVGPTVDQTVSRWYLALKNKEITAGQIKCDPYVVNKKTKLTIETKGESGVLWIIIYMSFSKGVVRKEVSELSMTPWIIVAAKVNKKELKFADQFTLSKQQALGADSSVLILLRKPIDLETGGSLTLEFTVCPQFKKTGFKVHNIDLVKSRLKNEIEGRKDITRMKRDETFHQKKESPKKVLPVEKKIMPVEKKILNVKACGAASGSNSGVSSSSTSSSAANTATSGAVKNAISPIATCAASGTANSTLSSVSGIVNTSTHKLSDGAAHIFSSVSSSSNSTSSSTPSSNLINTATSTTANATTNTIVVPTNGATNSATNTSDDSITGCPQKTPIAPAHCQSASESSIKPASSANTTVPIAVTDVSSPSTPENNKAKKVDEDKTSAVKPIPSALTDQKYEQTSQWSPVEFVKIAAYKIDKSGTKLATLSYSERSFYLDIWDIEDAMHDPGLNGKIVEIDVATGKTPPSSSSSTQPLASLKNEIGHQLQWNHHKNMTVALSFDAAQVALIPHSVVEPKPRPLLLFECNLARKTLVDDDPHEDLKWFVGYGDFCCPLSEDGTPDTVHEKFLACDGYSVTVYRCPADRPWTLLWNLSLAEAPSRSPTPSVDHGKHRRSSADPLYCPGAHPVCGSLLPKPTPTHEGLTLAKKLVQGVRHRYFAWTGHARAVTIWNFEMGTVVSYIPLPYEHKVSDICTYLSVDGSVTVVWYKGHGIVGTYWTVSGICIKEYKEKAGIFGGQFLVTESVKSGQIDLQKATSHLVSLLDGSKRHLAKSLDDLHGTITISSTGNQSLLHLEGSLVTVTGLDTAFTDISNNWDCRPICGELAAPKLSEDRIYRAGAENDPGVIFDFRRVNGTQFVMERALVSGRVLYTLKLIFKEEPKERTVLMFSHKFKYAMLLGDAEHLILVDQRYVQIWMIPSSYAMHCRLLLAWSVNQGTDSDGFWGVPFKPRLCRHRRTLTMDTRKTGQSITLNLSDPKVFSEKTAGRFLGGMQLLMEMYTSIREINPQTPGHRRDYLTSAIYKYLGGYINHNPTPHQPSNTVLAQICHSWTYEAREMYKDILLNILHSWSPAPYYRPYKDSDGNTVSSNPINILLTRNEAFVINTARLFYKSCLRRAKETGQIGYLAPVFDSLPLLFLQHQEHAFKYFRKMALIKAAAASFLRETYPVVAHTEAGQWCHQQTEDASPCSNQPADLEDTDDEGNGDESDVYVASYGMLWKYSDHGAEEGEVSTLSWLAKVLGQGLNPFGHNFIKRHQFCLKFLDNPAIEALIDQKWNTIGLRYWRVCFISQCCVLALLLRVVLGQLNGSGQNELFGDFVAIVTFAAFFLWLKIMQVFFRTDEDSSLGYNIVGILAFSVPLAGSVNQIWIALGGKVLDAACLFSLSLVVFSLHLLFELRVSKSIYKFVSILIAVVSGLKTVLLVLTLSIIVFGTAILHAFALSATATVAVPRTAYFLMFLFIFFAVIVILYILLDLMNATYKVADAEWLLHWNENRLCYIERAENWTMIFPGFRNGDGVLPSRHVFFSPAPAALRAFKARHQEARATPFTTRN